MEKMIVRNKKLILKIMEELKIKEAYEYLMSSSVNSIYLSLETDKGFELAPYFVGRIRMFIKYSEGSVKRRKAIKSLRFSFDKTEDETLSLAKFKGNYETLCNQRAKIEDLTKLFRQQKILKELISLEEELYELFLE